MKPETLQTNQVSSYFICRLLVWADILDLVFLDIMNSLFYERKWFFGVMSSLTWNLRLVLNITLLRSIQYNQGIKLDISFQLNTIVQIIRMKLYIKPYLERTTSSKTLFSLCALSSTHRSGGGSKWHRLCLGHLQGHSGCLRHSTEGQHHCSQQEVSDGAFRARPLRIHAHR